MPLLKHRDRLPLARDWPLAAVPTWRWFDDRSWDVGPWKARVADLVAGAG